MISSCSTGGWRGAGHRAGTLKTPSVRLAGRIAGARVPALPEQLADRSYSIFQVGFVTRNFRIARQALSRCGRHRILQESPADTGEIVDGTSTPTDCGRHDETIEGGRQGRGRGPLSREPGFGMRETKGADSFHHPPLSFSVDVRFDAAGQR
ncbi:hypothetical protein [Burkholderia gladioli]|uniref:hypothetical protein n=1 Tax=Burkholderia gladioli TaxID=28095 RepID=UPI0034DAE2B5